MASITIRNLDDDVKTLLRVRAARNGRSMEEEVRLILREAVDRKTGPENLASAIRARFARLACISHHLTAEARDKTARTSLRLLAVLNVQSSTPARAKRLAPRPDGPLRHFVSPRGEKCRLGGVDLELPLREPANEPRRARRQRRR